jgi:signal transduction histidine kinase
MSSSLCIAAFARLPLPIIVVLVGAGVVLWRSKFEGREALRIAGWVVLVMTTIGLLAVWIITHQNIRGRSFVHAPFVLVNNLSAGGLIGFLIGWYDVLRLRYQNQAETERARLEFLHGSLRHNVLNGLNIILGTVHGLDGKVDAAHDDALETIRKRGEELTRFTEATNALMANFLDRPDTYTRPIDLSATLTEEVEKARTQYDHAEFSMEVPDDVYIEGDDFVAELFWNLLSNAVVHNDKPTPVVSVTSHRTDEAVVVRVADNGPGIVDGEKERVLKWNVKGVDSPGTGLGLSIANTVAGRYGGTLWIEDNEPEGTALHVKLPRTDRIDDATQDETGTS